MPSADNPCSFAAASPVATWAAWRPARDPLFLFVNDVETHFCVERECALRPERDRRAILVLPLHDAPGCLTFHRRKRGR